MRNSGIDILRGVSISVVMVMHFLIIPPFELGFSPTVREALFNGVYGVTAFFVISGYLITSNTIRRYGDLQAVSLRQFYWMRFCRIGPLLMALLAINAALSISGIGAFKLPDGIRIQTPLIAALTFTFNTFRHYYGGIRFNWDILWSLSVEEMFYLLFPIFCIALGRRAVPCLLGVFAYGLVYRWLYMRFSVNSIFDNGGTFDAIAVGCIVAILLTGKKWPLPRIFVKSVRIIGWCGFGVAYVMLPYGSHSWSFSVIILSAATIIATFALDHEPLSTAAAVLSAPLRLVGRYSYELYLIHGVMIMAIDAVIVKFGGFTPMPITLHGVTLTPGIPALAIYFALTITVAVALGRFFSEPMNRYLRSIQLPILTGRGECSDQNNGN